MNNRYGLDDQYFRKWMKRVLASGLEHYTPQELARELARMSKAAAPEVMHEPEFTLDVGGRGVAGDRDQWKYTEGPRFP